MTTHLSKLIQANEITPIPENLEKETKRESNDDVLEQARWEFQSRGLHSVEKGETVLSLANEFVPAVLSIQQQRPLERIRKSHHTSSKIQ